MKATSVVHAIEPLAKYHKREDFRCGVDSLDRYLKHQASQDARRRIAAPKVVTTEDNTVISYYTLSSHMISMRILPESEARRLPSYPTVPATLIGRFAVDQRYTGGGLGRYTLMNALQRALDVSADVASYAVAVDAINADAIAFYKKQGFSMLGGTSNRLYLPMKEIAKST